MFSIIKNKKIIRCGEQDDDIDDPDIPITSNSVVSCADPIN